MKYLRAALPVLALVLVAGSASALPQEERILLLQTPGERAHVWQNSFLKFVAEHPELSAEKVQALEDLARVEDLRFFLNSPTQARRDVLTGRMVQLSRVLSAFEFHQLIASAPEELVGWMKSTEIIEPDGSVPRCNCGDTQDCSGGACRNVDCIHEAGTSHNGRC